MLLSLFCVIYLSIVNWLIKKKETIPSPNSVLTSAAHVPNPNSILGERT